MNRNQIHHGLLDAGFVRCKETENECKITNFSKISELLHNYLVKLNCKRNVLTNEDVKFNAPCSNIIQKSSFDVPTKNKNFTNLSNTYKNFNQIIQKSDDEKNTSTELNDTSVKFSAHLNKQEVNQNAEYNTEYVHLSSIISNPKKTSKCRTQKEESKKNKKSSSLGNVERPHVCSKCKMSFKRNLHLKRHFVVTHTLSKNFSCEICGKSFSRKDYLDKHTKSHQKKNFKLKLLEQGIVVRTKIFSRTNTEHK